MIGLIILGIVIIGGALIFMGLSEEVNPFGVIGVIL